jgi:hypothetical protein
MSRRTKNKIQPEDDEVKKNDDDEEEEGGDDDVLVRTSNLEGSAVLRHLAHKKSSLKQSEISLSHVVEHVKRSHDVLKPAMELKSLFGHGRIGEKFRKMYARDSLHSHAIGSEALVQLNAEDLAGILGSKKAGERVLSLYHELKKSEEEQINFLDVLDFGVGVDDGMDEMDGMERDGMVGDFGGGGMAGGGGGGGDGAEISEDSDAVGGEAEGGGAPMMLQMAQAINALSDQLGMIADAVVTDQEARKLYAPVKIQVEGSSRRASVGMDERLHVELLHIKAVQSQQMARDHLERQYGNVMNLRRMNARGPTRLKLTQTPRKSPSKNNTNTKSMKPRRSLSFGSE